MLTSERDVTDRAQAEQSGGSPDPSLLVRLRHRVFPPWPDRRFRLWLGTGPATGPWPAHPRRRLRRGPLPDRRPGPRGGPARRGRELARILQGLSRSISPDAILAAIVEELRAGPAPTIRRRPPPTRRPGARGDACQRPHRRLHGIDAVPDRRSRGSRGSATASATASPSRSRSRSTRRAPARPSSRFAGAWPRSSRASLATAAGAGRRSRRRRAPRARRRDPADDRAPAPRPGPPRLPAAGRASASSIPTGSSRSGSPSGPGPSSGSATRSSRR